MNKTRRKITELIEPYMDKTWCNGLLVWTKLQDGNFGFDELREESDYSNGIGKILGHYDITAVLKYIYNNGYEYMGDKDETVFSIDLGFNNIGEIPNKPLTCYSPQEEEYLLKLLQKLGNK